MNWINIAQEKLKDMATDLGFTLVILDDGVEYTLLTSEGEIVARSPHMGSIEFYMLGFAAGRYL